MSRRIQTHLTPGAVNETVVLANDAPNEKSGANHEYLIGKPTKLPDGDGVEILSTIKFHQGPLAKAEDLAGITNESLLAILIDRFQGFQRGQFSCRENAIVLTKLEEAMLWTKKRTADRVLRGVEGTHTK